MAHPQTNSRNLPDSVIQEIVSAEHKKIELRSEELKIRSQEIESNERIAKISLEQQFKLLEKQPKQHKETIITYTACIGFLIILLLGFLFLLTINGQQSFALEFLKWSSYLIVAILSFLGGRASVRKKQDSDSNVQDATIL